MLIHKDTQSIKYYNDKNRVYRLNVGEEKTKQHGPAKMHW